MTCRQYFFEHFGSGTGIQLFLVNSVHAMNMIEDQAFMG
jgi:hypothetical protein